MVDMIMGCGPTVSSTVSPNLRLFILVASMLLYLTFGALIFSKLEEEYQDGFMEELRQSRNELLSKMKTGTVTDDELEVFLAAVVEATQQGIIVTNNVSFISSWTFGQSFFFVGTLVTTIGYGHTHPLSHNGKIFAIFYCLFGIPLTLLMFTVLVARFIRLLSRLLDWMKIKMINFKEVHVKVLHLSILALIVIVFIFLVPAVIFMVLEDRWSYLDSLYYCIISLTTVGLGDYVPGEHHSQPYKAIYKVATTFYLFIGLICALTVLAVFNNISEFNIPKYFLAAEETHEDTEKELLTANSATKNPKYSAEDNQVDLGS